MPIVLAGATSGQATVQATDAQTVTLTLPATTGTLAVSGGSPSFATLTVTGDASISGLTVGKGGGSLSTNTAIGASALAATNTGGFSVAVGQNAGAANTSGQITAVGNSALYTNTTGSQNTAFGISSLYANSTGGFNTAIGVGSLAANTTQNYNTAVGYQAGNANTTGQITAVGSQSLLANTTGTNNVAVGILALQANTTASNNTAVGYQAGYSGTTGADNTHYGYKSGYSRTTGAGNTLIGDSAGYSLTTGHANTFVGAGQYSTNGAGYYVTTGSNNTVLGGYDGNQNGLDIRTASNYIVLSDGNGTVRLGIDNSGFVFVGTTRAALAGSTFSVQNVGGTAGYFEQTGAGGYNVVLRTVSNGGTWYFQQFATYPTNTENGTITSNGSNVSYNTSSDYRLKENIAPLSGGLDRVLQLKPVTYRWKETGLDGEGFIAHELQEVIPEAVVGTKDQVNEDGSIKPQGIDTSFVVATLVAAIQELKATVDAQAARIAVLEGAK